MFTLENSNINFLGFKIDTNGNKVAKFGFTNNSKKFSIQVNGNFKCFSITEDDFSSFSKNYYIKKELYQYLYSTNSKLFSIIEDKAPFLFTLEQLKNACGLDWQIEVKDFLRGKIHSKNYIYSSELQTIVNTAVANNLFTNPRKSVIDYLHYHTDKFYYGYITYFDKENNLVVYYCGNGEGKTSMARAINKAIPNI